MKNLKKLIKEFKSEVLLWTNFWYIYLKNKDKQKENIISLCFILNLFVLIILLYSHNKTGIIPIENPKINTLTMPLGGPKNVENIEVKISLKKWNWFQDYIGKLNDNLILSEKEEAIAKKISNEILDQIGIEKFNAWQDNKITLEPISKTGKSLFNVDSSSEFDPKIQPMDYVYFILIIILLGAIGYGCYKFYRWWYQI